AMLSEISERSFSSCSCMRYPRGLLRLELLRLSDGEHVASGLYLDHYQSHIILLRATVHEGRNLVHDPLKNLLALPPSPRAKELSRRCSPHSSPSRFAASVIPSVQATTISPSSS